ncbi:MAG: hypothetical protein Q4G22_12300 [Paracoccus sp. (in: a-proteobacteria)]|uniref:hypothetical protein n=1 Tax=Paracoccus sp. TaxID=267 RepID=UPI0026E0EE11|nr:hypothetical protein [Paracoccus sp. (in: a-proteobacteria)]MDO5632604.1 hypothetical protein [Paracoccus sp. (in: a-proteobacteria)]
MTTLNNILTASGLSADDVARLTEGQAKAAVNTALRSEWLMQHRHGTGQLARTVCEDIKETLRLGDLDHARTLYATLKAVLSEQTAPAGR